MQFKTTQFEGLIECFPTIFADERGHFYETYHETKFAQNGIKEKFVQDNFSKSKKGVVRGLHFQHSPHAQGKLVRCMTGKALDVVVDLRIDSPTFGKHDKFLLDAEVGNMLYVPAGFAHGFVALEETIFVYKCTDVWNKNAESGILWNDKDLAIDWGVASPIVSDKDLVLPTFQEIASLLQAQK
ncbi:MAG: dTDP-4-dehydrorhamnose 3,5-epimerase [Pseudarcicella sp.]|jgi:dTDP-4-dehydrorhamnose 3,5-epimerase|nr:dTDP-4-dehydrorhamnose 3,5-epimerase [Pseudarcicella sp.]MBP6411012.1 dTDP-4-dehydrorhamnose 3,5-epimerase [Pseudarcicella sp.]